MILPENQEKGQEISLDENKALMEALEKRMFEKYDKTFRALAKGESENSSKND